MMARTIQGETKRGRPKKGQRTHNPKGPKRGRELVSLMVGSYFTHGPSYVTSMQIGRSNSSIGLVTATFDKKDLVFSSPVKVDS
jgi:hypothetical protein